MPETTERKEFDCGRVPRHVQAHARWRMTIFARLRQAVEFFFSSRRGAMRDATSLEGVRPIGQPAGYFRTGGTSCPSPADVRVAENAAPTSRFPSRFDSAGAGSEGAVLSRSAANPTLDTGYAF